MANVGGEWRGRFAAPTQPVSVHAFGARHRIAGRFMFLDDAYRYAFPFHFMVSRPVVSNCESPKAAQYVLDAHSTRDSYKLDHHGGDGHE